MAAKQEDPYADLKNMVETMARMLADKPEEIVVNEAKGNGFVAYEVLCDEGDVGTIVGRRGVHADAMRTLLMAAGTSRRIRVTVQFLSREQDGLPPR